MRTSSAKPGSASRQRATGRRSPLATVALITIGLVMTGGAYALASTTAAATTPTIVHQASAEEGQKLFAANCANCHGLDAAGTDEGPTLHGVGAASADFQLGTGRMPLAMQGPQGEKKNPQFTPEQIADLVAYVASLAPGPDVPESRYLQANGSASNGGELYRINCAMCHNVAGAGGALTEGKFAPNLNGIEAKHIYEAMVTGPQNMPVFSDLNLTPEDKKDIITYLKFMDNNPSVGGADLGSLGPVSEGLFIWIFGLGSIVAVTVWIAARPN